MVLPYHQILTIAQIGPFTITIWGLMAVIGFLAAFGIILWEGKRRKLDRETICTLMTLALIGGILGSRLVWLLTEASGITFIDAFKIWNGGMTWYGGFIGAAIAAYAYLRYKKVHVLKYLDLIAIGLPLGQAIGRVGCYLVGDHIGKQTILPWGINLPSAGGITHPIALYEIIALLGIFFIVLGESKKRRFDGWLLSLYVISYSFVRFFMDFLRADPTYFGLTIAQYVSIALFIGFGIFAWARGKENKLR